MVDPALQSELERALGARVISVHAASGGDINQAERLVLEGGRAVFLKWHRRPPLGMFEAEADGLAFLRSAALRGGARALVIPEVLSCGARHLVLEALEFSARSQDDEAFGRELALLHRASLPRFGHERSGFIATLPQDNTSASDWASFYRKRRIGAQLELPAARRHVPSSLRREVERLCERADDLCGPSEPPAPLHGDLWSGNWGMTARGPALFDPAAYGGHREVDLAMLRLFGSPSARFFDAYDEVYPRAPGHEDRVAFYQLYPLLVHVNLFGSGYVGSVADVVRRYA